MRKFYCVITLLAFGAFPSGAQQKTKPYLRSSNTIIRGATAQIVEYEGSSLRSDGFGAYQDRKQNSAVAAAMSFVLCASVPCVGEDSPPVPRTRSLSFDLSRPVRSSGAVPLGMVHDNTGQVNTFWTHDHSEDPDAAELIHSFVDTPVGQTIASTRVEMWLVIGGKQHALQMGPWTQGEFSRGRWPIPGHGTSQAEITRSSETSWRIMARKGAIARLWDYSAKRPIDKGLYYFDFTILATIPGSLPPSRKEP